MTHALVHARSHPLDIVRLELLETRLYLGQHEDEIEALVDQVLLAHGILDLVAQVIEGQAKVPPERLVVGHDVLAQVVHSIDESARLLRQVVVLAQKAHVVELAPVRVDAFGAQERGHVAAVQRLGALVPLLVEAERELGNKDENIEPNFVICFLLFLTFFFYLGKEERLIVEHEHGLVLVYVGDERVEDVVGAYFDAVLETAEDAKERAGPRVPVHEQLEQVLAARVLFEAVVAEFDLVAANIVGQVEDEVAKGRTRVEDDLVDFDVVEAEQQLIREAQRGVEVAVGGYTPLLFG